MNLKCNVKIEPIKTIKSPQQVGYSLNNSTALSGQHPLGILILEHSHGGEEWMLTSTHRQESKDCKPDLVDQ